MTILSILIALLMERLTPQLVEFRRFHWLQDYCQWMQDVLHIEKPGAWMGLAILLAPLLGVVWVLGGMFDSTDSGAVSGLFDLAFNVLVIFMCLGPKALDSEIEQYLDSIDVGDTQQRFNMARQITIKDPAMDLPEQIEQVSKAIFMQANSRIFGVLFWFVMFGPMAAVLYRVLEQLLGQSYLQQSMDSIRQIIRLVLGWIDWIPVRISLFAFMLSGSYEEGLRAFRQGNILSIDTYEGNNELLQTVGYQSISSDKVESNDQATSMVRKSRGLTLRSLVVWILLLLFISFIS